jgi:Na+-transporting methylmalonyl-CoA/oxaloacetate decarboxylase gamma subunit
MITILGISDITAYIIMIAILGYVIVFFSLLFLHLFFYYLPKLLYAKWKRERLASGKVEVSEEVSNISGEETAAIAMALHLFLEVHDEESGVLTINKVSKPYSPWSSKIYAVRNQFNRI